MCMYIYIYMCVYVYIYMCVCIYIYIQPHKTTNRSLICPTSEIPAWKKPSTVPLCGAKKRLPVLKKDGLIMVNNSS